MDIKQIKDSLNKIFNEENRRIIFWYDAEKEFEDSISSIEIDGVNIFHLNEIGSLELKIRLELEDTTGKYILYAPYPEPSPEKDWLYDIRLYSKSFHADMASIILDELKLENQSMRLYLKERKNFFKSHDRLNRLKKLADPKDREVNLDLKMLAVLTRAQHPDIFLILMKIFAAFCDNGNASRAFNPNQPPKVWDKITKFDLKKAFWVIIARTFGYAPESPELMDLMVRLLVTDVSNHLKADLPGNVRHFLITDRLQAMNASVFLSQWRSNIDHLQNYNKISGYFAKELKIIDIILPFNADQLLEVMTFEAVEKKIISCLRDIIVDDLENKIDEVKSIIQQRRDGYWTNAIFGNKGRYSFYGTIYSALEIAVSLFELRKKYDAGFSFPVPEDMIKGYTNELFRFDQYYRQFVEAANSVELSGGDVLKKLQNEVENCYSGWFIDQLALTWGEFLEQGQTKLLNKWQTSNINNQYDFYEKQVKQVFKRTTINRIFVIISDAFRFEVAEELTRLINGKYRFKAKLDFMLGVLPSITSLGMAALLPHKEITFKDDANLSVILDEMPTGSIELRSAVLSKYDGTAIKAEDFLAMSRSEGREFIKPHKVIYIYHNQIDAIGDKAGTESKTFEAARASIEELEALAQFIINSLNGHHVVVSSDHGFIYQDKPPENIDKSTIKEKPSGTKKQKKRFILGKDLGESAKVLHGNTRTTAGTADDMEFWIPKGTNRFHFAGGARFFHGGAMLQEIIVPVITIEHQRGKKVQKSEVAKVGVSVLGMQNKIVTNIHNFEFIQTDAVSERMRQRVLNVSLRDKNNHLISNEKIITFDSRSSSIDNRKKSIRLMLKSGEYDKKQEYFLVMREADTDIEYFRKPMFIDLAFTSDF